MSMEQFTGKLPQVAELDKQIDALEDRLIDLKGQRQEFINTAAQGVAKFKVGYEFTRRKRTYRITAVKGEYYPASEFAPPIVWVRYRGVCLFKNGNVGREETLYPEVSR